MIINLKGEFSLTDDFKIDFYKENKLTNLFYQGFKITLNPGNCSITVEVSREINDVIFNCLNGNDMTKKELTINLLKQFYTEVQSLFRKVIYFDGIFEVNTKIPLKSQYTWSKDGITWLPTPKFTSWRPGMPIYTVPDGLFPGVLHLLNSNIEPFFAFEFLHKAFEENNFKAKIIFATTAAEHAFKEFLIRHSPHLHTLTLKMPSPPISILYSTVLKEFTGEQSPMYKEIQKLMETRNELIHKPIPEKLKIKTIDEAELACNQVAVAMYHLLYLLYKDEEMIKYFLKIAKEKLQRISPKEI